MQLIEAAQLKHGLQLIKAAATKDMHGRERQAPSRQVLTCVFVCVLHRGFWQTSPDGRNMEVTTTLNRLYTDLDSLVNAGPGVVEQELN